MPSYPFGLVGLGGFATGICEALLTRAHIRPLQLTHVFEPEFERFPELVSRLQARHVVLSRTYEEFLRSHIDAVWVAVPIDQHRLLTEAALAAGKAVLCEKPAAGSIQEVDGMIRARDDARCPVAIGYQEIYADSTLDIKQRLLRGDLGNLQHASLTACLPRTADYYSRSWSGQIQRNGKWLLDSPLSNALSHCVHLALFLMGGELNTSAAPVALEAELYRVNNILNYDTCSLRVTLATGASLLINLTHASNSDVNPILTLQGSAGAMTYDFTRKRASLGEQLITLSDTRHEQTLRGFESLLYEPELPRLHASLEMSRAFALIVSGASQVAPIHDLPESAVANRIHDRFPLRYIPGIEEMFRTLAKRHQTLNESGLADWSTPARKISLTDYRLFTGPAENQNALAR